MKRAFFGLLSIVCFLGVLSVGSVRAADFTIWASTWFKGTEVSEKGFRAPVLPAGGSVKKDNMSLPDIFVEIVSCDITLAACSVNVCTYDPSTLAWTLSTDITAPIIGGHALDFLTLLDTSTKATGVTEHYVVPLRVKAKVFKKAPNTLKSASFTTLGGYHEKTYGDPVTDMGVGSIAFQGKMIPAAKVATKVPGACIPE